MASGATKAKKHGGKAEGPKGAKDDRFSAMHTDPRFRRFPKKDGQVQIDSRFSGMFTDSSFEVRSAVDKRGRKMGKGRNKEDMRRYYRLAAEEEAQEAAGGEAQEAVAAKGEARKSSKPKKLSGKPRAGRDSSPCSSGSEEDGAGADDSASASSGSDGEAHPEKAGEARGDRAREMFLRARGLAGSDSSSDEEGSQGSDSEEDKASAQADAGLLDSGSGTDGSDEDDVEAKASEDSEDEEDFVQKMQQYFGIGAVAALDEDQQDVEQVEEATRRVALVDLDWRHVQAVDILTVLRSFCGAKGRVEAVTVYPSDYGLERMEQETISGPQGIFAEADEDDGSEGEGIDKERLRFYERSRLRYYYAVAEFDTAATANRIYTECDGLEFEHSSCRLDMRFVPDDMDLSTRQVRDSATTVPAGYVAPMFHTKALQHSNVQLTWEADDTRRKKVLQRAVMEDDAKEDDLKAFLASDDSSGGEDGEEDAEKIRERYRSLLGLGGSEAAVGRKGAKDWKDTPADESGGESGGAAVEEKGMDMEVTFQPSLDALGDRLKNRKMGKGRGKDKGAETVWEAYLQKQKEKRALKKARRKGGDDSDDGDEDAVASDVDDGLYTRGGNDEADPFFQHDGEDPFSDPFFAHAEEAPEGQVVEGKGLKSRKTKANATDPGKGVGASKSSKAELEMLLMKDTELLAATRGVLPGKEGAGRLESAENGAKRLSKKERLKAKKEARARARRDDSDDEELRGGDSTKNPNFKTDLDDSRFKALYSDPRFALDPTDPDFKRATGTAELAKEVASRRKAAGSSSTGGGSRAAADHPHGESSASKPTGGQSSGPSIESMVASLKRKADTKARAKPDVPKMKRKRKGKQ